MRVLLDTHTFIGLDSTPETLSAQVRQICQDTSNELYISLASLWEVQIKLSLGKLKFPHQLSEIVQWQQQNNAVQILPIRLSHI